MNNADRGSSVSAVSRIWGARTGLHQRQGVFLFCKLSSLFLEPGALYR